MRQRHNDKVAVKCRGERVVMLMGVMSDAMHVDIDAYTLV